MIRKLNIGHPILLFLATILLSPAILFPSTVHAVSDTQIIDGLQRMYQNFDGVALCRYNDPAGSCIRYTMDAADPDLRDGENNPDIGDDTLSIIAASTPVTINLSSTKGAGPQLTFTYRLGNTPTCTYQFITSGDEEDPNSPRTTLDCTNGIDGKSAIIATSIHNEDGSVKIIYAVNLDKLCVIDSSGTGESCDNKWYRAVSAYSVTGLGTSGYISEEDPGGAQVPLDIAGRINNLYIWMVSLAGLVALGIIVYGGVLYAASAGNPSRMSDAKTWITGALLGLSLLLGAYILLNFVNPDLTKLEDVFLTSNPTIGAPGVEYLSGGGGSFGEFTCPMRENTYQAFITTFGSFGYDRGDHIHSGIDINANAGTPLLAVESGVIQNNTYDSKSGNKVYLLGDSGRIYRYCHLQNYEPMVDVGERVTTGQQVGLVDSTGNSSANHLHISIYENGEPVDPFPFLTQSAGCYLSYVAH